MGCRPQEAVMADGDARTVACSMCTRMSQYILQNELARVAFVCINMVDAAAAVISCVDEDAHACTSLLFLHTSSAWALTGIDLLNAYLLLIWT